jgi:hypothetical protein
MDEYNPWMENLSYANQLSIKSMISSIHIWKI